MSDRVTAEIVKWALWTGTGAAALVMISWPPGYPLRVWKWREYEEARDRRIAQMRDAWNAAMGGPR